MKIDKRKINKAFSSFGRNGRSISRILETNFPIGFKNSLPMYDGIYTIKLEEHPDVEINPSRKIAKDIFANNIFQGYHDVDGNPIHFLGKKHKLVKTLMRSFYHVIADDLAEIVYALSLKPDSELILNVSDIHDVLDNPEWDLVKFFLRCLDEHKVKYTLVDFNKFDVLYIENFTSLTFPFHSGARLDLLSEFLLDHVPGDRVEEPYRKVFVSRKHTEASYVVPDAVNFSYKNDVRIDNQQNLEDIFTELGFEIVYAESIGSFEDQVRFFDSVKVLAGVTGSGLTNAIFMRPETVMIEIATPLITHSPLISGGYFKENKIDPTEMFPNPNMVQEIHMFYHNLAFFKSILYLSIPNFTRESEKIKEFIDNNKAFKRFITNEQSNNL